MFHTNGAGGELLRIEGLHTEFATRAGIVRAVDGIDLRLRRGEILGLVGESGSGKSVTGFSIIGLIDEPGRVTAGRIVFDGQDLLAAGEPALARLRGSRIAMIFQDPMMTLNPLLRIDTQMIEAIRAHSKVGRDAAWRRARDALGLVGIPSPEERLRAYPHQFSGGMRQRVVIAIAMLHAPDLIIADEPTTALDVTIQAQILHEMQRLRREREMALIWITHDLSVVAGLADRVAVMYAGRIVEQGSVDEVLDSPEHPYTEGLIGSIPNHDAAGGALAQIPGMMPSLIDVGPGCRFRERCPRATRRCRDDDPAPALDRRRAPGVLSPPGQRAMTSALLSLRGVSRHFVKPLDLVARAAGRLGANLREEVVRAVDGVDLSIEAGEVVGLVGESGCGKSTLGRVVAGIHEPTSGTLAFRGRPVARMSREERADYTLKVQMIFQDPYASLSPRQRVGRIIGEAPDVHGIWRRDELDDRVDEVMLRVGLDPALKRRYPHQFSGGQRQRIGIARALAVAPEFLVCDEAVAALDVSIQAQILNLFMRLRAELDLTYLFISHDLGVVRHLSDRVVIMYLGRVVERAPTSVLFGRPNHPYTRALLAEVPRMDLRHRAFEPIRGEIPSPLDPPQGCHFHPRCPHALPRCRTEVPRLREVAAGHWSACHLNDVA